MIDIEKAKTSFRKFLEKYQEQDKAGFGLKVSHTGHVMDISREIAAKLGLSDDEIRLAELIALLHDIGRFEEINFTNRFDGPGFDHASWAVKMLFENHLIRAFLADSSDDEIIKNAIANHSRMAIQDGLDDRSLLYARILRDADKLDNFRVKKEEQIEAIFPGSTITKEDMENSILSHKVYETVKSKKCVDIHDRVTPLDHWVCVLAFVFDLYFRESYGIVKENQYIDILIDKWNYHNPETRDKMEEIRKLLNDFVDSHL